MTSTWTASCEGKCFAEVAALFLGLACRCVLQHVVELKPNDKRGNDSWIKSSSKVSHLSVTSNTDELCNTSEHSCLIATYHQLSLLDRRVLTLLIFSPWRCGINRRREWKPVFMLCIRRLSFEFAICLRSFLSTGLLWLSEEGCGLLFCEKGKKLCQINKLQWIIGKPRSLSF